jgi:hypothetical protein
MSSQPGRYCHLRNLTYRLLELEAPVRACACYRLETGRDFSALPGLFRSLLD